jgi:hypothetical protein
VREEETPRFEGMARGRVHRGEPDCPCHAAFCP